MLKKLRRRVIAINFGMIATVLLIILLTVNVYMRQQYLENLESTMQTLLQPLTLSMGEDEAGNAASASVVGATYRKDSGYITFFLRDSSVVDADLTDAIRAAYEQEEDFGHLREYGVYYCRMDADDDMKIALMSDETVHLFMSELMLLLAGIYAVSLAVFWAISVLLSAIALRPVRESWEREQKFLTDASHELKTPLTVIRANMSILKNDPAVCGTEAIRWITSSDETAAFMSDLVENMLNYSAAAENRPQPTRLNFTEMVERFVLQMEAVAYEKQVALVLDAQEDVFITADAGSMNQVLQNMLGNAVKYEPKGGEVTVELVDKADGVRLRITNRLSRIDEAHATQLFDRFYRHNPGSHVHGHGLGLAIARRTIENMGGTITVYNSENLGVCFEAHFPVKK